jgi:hypothetical protein
MIDYERVLIFAIAVGVGFLVLRELACWYWKVNERNALLRNILTELRTLNGRQPAKQGDGTVTR